MIFSSYICYLRMREVPLSICEYDFVLKAITEGLVSDLIRLKLLISLPQHLIYKIKYNC